MKMNNNKIFVKDYNKVKLKDIQFALSNKTSKDNMNYWTVPFYNIKEDKVCVIVWNNKDDDPINVNFIINNERMINFNSVSKFGWELKEVGKLEDIDSIIILVNGKTKNEIDFRGHGFREKFRITNYAAYD